MFRSDTFGTPRRMTDVVSGSADGLNPPEESFTAERLALAETLSAPLQGEEPFERLVRTVIDGMVPHLGGVAIAVIPEEGDDYDIIASAHNADYAEQVRHRVRELLPVLTKLAREELRRGRTFHWLPTVRRSALRLQSRHGADLFPHLEALGLQSLIAVGLRAGGHWVGALAVARTKGAEPYHAIDLAVVQVVARRIAL